jgi:DNA-binding transcriptional LysR family regulator
MFRAVDLNLLPVFAAVYEERSLTRAAMRLSMTQSAVSHALSRLRAQFRDELFFRESRGVAPTPMADSIFSKVRPALASIHDAVVEAREFDPRTSDRKFFVAITHPLGPLLAARFREQLAQAAPNFVVEFSTRSRPIDFDRTLRTGRIDAAIDWLRPADDQFSTLRLFDDRLVAVARRGHPALRRSSPPRNWNSFEFVALRPRVQDENPVPGIREWQQFDMRVTLEVSELIEVLLVASESSLCGLIPLSLEALADRLFGLKMIPGSPKTQRFPLSLVWPRSRDSDRAHTFLREQLAAAASVLTTRLADRPSGAPL